MSLDLANMGERVEAYRKARKMTLQNLADGAGLSKSYVWEIENGKNKNPTVATVWSIAEALCVSPNDLLLSDPDMALLDPLVAEVATLIHAELRRRER